MLGLMVFGYFWFVCCWVFSWFVGYLFVGIGVVFSLIVDLILFLA